MKNRSVLQESNAFQWLKNQCIAKGLQSPFYGSLPPKSVSLFAVFVVRRSCLLFCIAFLVVQTVIAVGVEAYSYLYFFFSSIFY